MWTKTEEEIDEESIENKLLDLMGRRRFSRKQLDRRVESMDGMDTTSIDFEMLEEERSFYDSRIVKLTSSIDEIHRAHPSVLAGFFQEEGVTTIHPIRSPSEALPGDQGGAMEVTDGGHRQVGTTIV
jgi:hypothetical protein